MHKFRAFFLRLRGIFHSRPNEDFADELETHVALHIDDGVRSGLTPEEARRQALIRLGGAEQARQAHRNRRTLPWIEGALHDLRYALRQLRRSPGFAITVVLTLTLGIGANLAIFQLLYAVVFAHLPVKQPEQLFSLHAAPSPFDGEWFFSFQAYQRLRQSSQNGAQVFARSGIGGGVLQQQDGSAASIGFQLVSDNFFNVLELTPAAGSFFRPGDDQRQQSEWPVILRHGFFKEHFGGDRSIIGRRATLNGIPIVVIGVAPEGFNGVVQSMAPDAWLPLAAQSAGRFGTWFDSMGPGFDVTLDRSWLNQPTVFWLWTLARVPGGNQAALTAHWTASVTQDLSLIASGTKDPKARARILASQVKLVPAASGEGSLHSRYALPLKILLAMSCTVLLIGCLNQANLQIARMLRRQREFSIRISLGASPLRVLRQVAIEIAVLGAAGGLLAVLAAGFSSSVLLQWASRRGFPLPLDVRIGAPALLVGVALLVAALLGFGLLPAWQMTRGSGTANPALRVSGMANQSRAGRRWSDLLLSSQVCFSLLLVCAAALFARTLDRIGRIDAGLDRDHILTVHVDMRSTGFADQQHDLTSFYYGILDRIKTLPGVRDAAAHMCDIPECGWNTAFYVSGNTNLPQAQLHGEEDHVGVGYFHTLGIPLLAGRDFSAADTPHTMRVAILSRGYARKLFGDSSPIGHWIGYTAEKSHDFQVVGVVGDARLDGLRQDAPPYAYISLEQNPQPVQTFEVRYTGPLGSLPDDIRGVLHTLAPALPIDEIVPLNVEFEDDLMQERLLARLTGIFGALTLAMAGIGFYGLLSSRVVRRTSEIGIRMALGATRAQVQALFMRETLIILGAGMIPGAALSLVLHSVVRKLLYGAEKMDAWSLGFAIVALAVAGVAATFIPARRAASIDPMTALRTE